MTALRHPVRTPPRHLSTPARSVATSGPGRLRRVPGQAGVRVRVYADLLRPGGRS
ncbi:DUF6207 family protein [Streptomyces sp. NPDC048383]|uniref:DUF6207 family protein n=1 Tax=Streptomyces sp. NPDC048383 TaxID=3155386 RepID=UPI00341ABE32